MRIEDLISTSNLYDTFNRGVGFTRLSFADENQEGNISKMISIDIHKMSREDKNKFLSGFDKKAGAKIKATFGEQTSSMSVIGDVKKTLYQTNHIDSKRYKI